MRSALRIFKKDVRHLWPSIVLVVGIELLAGWAASAPSPGMARAYLGLGWIQALAQWFLIASVVQEESLVGDRQYWLTRPYSWKALLAAKLLFFLVFIHLPELAADVGALMARGESPMAHWAGLSMAQFFTLAMVLSAAALAAVSTGLAQFAGIFLAAFAGFLLTAETLAYLVRGDPSWGGLGWLHNAATAVVAIFCAAAILAVQYAARKTTLSRWIFAAGVLAMVSMMRMLEPHAAFELQCWLDGRRAPDSTARIVQDSPRGLETAPLPEASWGHTSMRAVEVPILIAGIPPGMKLQSDGVATSGVLPDGRVWSSGWDSINRLTNVVDTGKSTREERLLPGADPWLYVNADPSMAGRNLHATAALTLLAAEEITPLARPGRPTRVPQGGLCWVTGEYDLHIVCSWPAPTPGYAAVRIRMAGMPAGADQPLLSVSPGGQNLSYGPCASSGGLWQVVDASAEMSAAPSEIVVVTRRVAAHFERGVGIHPTGGGQLP
jgi:hypothetical protein